MFYKDDLASNGVELRDLKNVKILNPILSLAI